MCPKIKKIKENKEKKSDKYMYMQIVIISKSGLQKTPRDDAVEMIFNLCLVESKHVMYMHKINFI